MYMKINSLQFVHHAKLFFFTFCSPISIVNLRIKFKKIVSCKFSSTFCDL